MATYKRFEDLSIWQEARKIRNEIFKLTSNSLFKRDLGLRQQMLNSSGSAMDNIAEGFERDGNREFIQFLYIAKASIGELKSQLYKCLDECYFSQELFKNYYKLADDFNKNTGNFIIYLKTSEFKGIKNKKFLNQSLEKSPV